MMYLRPTNESIIAITPNVTGLDVELEGNLPVILGLTNKYAVEPKYEKEFYFHYREDPSVDDIQPKTIWHV